MGSILFQVLFIFSQTALALPPMTDGLFEPAYAADQPEVTVLSLEYELAQFQHLAEWKSLSNQIEGKKREATRKGKDFQRAKQAGVISPVDLAGKEFAAQEAESEVKMTTVKMLKARLNMAIFKQRLLAAGDASYDARPVIVRLSRMAAQEAINELDTLVVLLTEQSRLRKLFLEGGEKLHAQKAISLTELEKRRADYQKSLTDLNCAKLQMETVQKMLAGLDKTGQRLGI